MSSRAGRSDGVLGDRSEPHTISGSEKVSVRHQAAIGEEQLVGDVGRGVGSEEQGRPDHLVWFGDALLQTCRRHGGVFRRVKARGQAVGWRECGLLMR